MVSFHEQGGDREQNILCDADTLAFFEEKALRRVKKWKEEGKPKEEIRKNINFIFLDLFLKKLSKLLRNGGMKH